MSGGLSKTSFLKSVEAYDYHENKWTYLPDMNCARFFHGSVSMGNKMFMIGGTMTKTCEVFDSITEKFIYLKQKLPTPLLFVKSAVVIGYKIIVFPGFLTVKNKKVLVYDVLMDQCNVEENDLLDIYSVFTCSRLSVV